eukprot:TRINITY_DN7224_c0_g1_i2.p1 TRINITY_DN7224_c0_g1~~TRINITY_DN7224_c0_g1_i2.p1  ORF type:complete len:282 (+),score=38.51 TRINITY_DN7224_c0_g1_i2:128-973(+)
MAPKRKARPLPQQLSRLGSLLLVPVVVWTSDWLAFSAQEGALPTGLDLALGLVSAISVAAGLLDCFGVLPCPLGFLCCGVFLVQLFSLMVILLVSMSTGPADSSLPSLLPGRAESRGRPPQQAPVRVGQPIQAASFAQEPTYALSSDARLSVILACAGEGANICTLFRRSAVCDPRMCWRRNQTNQLVHWANRVSADSLLRGLQGHASPGFRCCSGIRFWSSDLCLDFINAGRGLLQGPCHALARTEGQWEEIGAFEPTDAKLYREGIKSEGLSDPAFLDT